MQFRVTRLTLYVYNVNKDYIHWIRLHTIAIRHHSVYVHTTIFLSHFKMMLIYTLNSFQFIILKRESYLRLQSSLPNSISCKISRGSFPCEYQMLFQHRDAVNQNHYP